MAFPNSLLFAHVWADTLNGAITGNKWGPSVSPDAIKVALYNNSVTGTVDDSSANAIYGAGSTTWGTTNEIIATGGTLANWAAGGVALSSNRLDDISTLGGTAGVGVAFTGGPVSAANVTIVSAQGCLIYDSTEAAKHAITAINFGAAYTSTLGTFSITFGSANSVSNCVFWILMHA